MPNPLALSMPTGDPDNPLTAGPDWASAWQYNTQAASDYIQQQRQQAVDQGLWDPQANRPTPKGMIAAAQGYGNALLMGTTAPGIKAFHGSPYAFERFDPSKIGTGEGAQAYGHGLYFAEAEPTAESYKLSGGSMYEVNLKADPEHFLDWDKPLSQQSEHVQQKIANLQSRGLLPRGWTKDDMDTLTGADAYQELMHKLPNAEHASGVLGDPVPGTGQGIAGVRYLDQGSRAEGKGTSNYVAFSPNTIDIIRRYGIAGLIGGGAAAGAATGNNQPGS